MPLSVLRTWFGGLLSWIILGAAIYCLYEWADGVDPLPRAREVIDPQTGRVTVIRGPVENLDHQGHQADRLQGVELAGRDMLPAEAMFFHTAQQSGCELPRSIGVECEENFSGRTSRKQKTNVPGLFVAGDADRDVQFVIIAAAEGAKAAVAINRELQDEDRS